jgi:hypothetical protein
VSQVRDIALIGRFILELLAIAAVSWWGFQLDSSTTVRILAGLLAPIALILVWMTFVSPKPRVVVSPAVRLAIELAIWVLALLAILNVPAIPAAVVFAALVVINLVALWYTRDTPSGLERLRERQS